jgi:hypothetical protein
MLRPSSGYMAVKNSARGEPVKHVNSAAAFQAGVSVATKSFRVTADAGSLVAKLAMLFSLNIS